MESTTTIAKPEQVLANSTLSEVLDDLCVRFIVFLPEEERRSVERICFQIEEAHWFYQDFIRPLNPGLPNVDLRMFIHQIFNHIPQSVIQHIPQGKTENAFTDFMVYKKRVPVRGAIMLNMAMNKCVLVKGWKSSSSFSFPRGKIDQDEDDRDCAMREALEETGFDLRGMVAENDFIELPVRDQNVKLYIAPGVPDDAKFAPQTRCEISEIKWHNLADLPGWAVKQRNGREPEQKTGKYYMVAPFMKGIKKWIATSGKKWLAQQQAAASEQQQEVTTAAMNFTEGLVENEPAASDLEPVGPSDSAAAGLRSLLGMQKAAEVVQHGEMTSKEQEEASQRLREMLGSGPSAPVNGTSHTSQALPSPAQPSKNAVNYESLAPNAKALLGILQSSGSQPTQTTEQPPTHSQPQPPPPPQQQFIPHSGPDGPIPHHVFAHQGMMHGQPPNFGMNHGPPPPGPFAGYAPHQPQQQQHRPPPGPVFPPRQDNGWPQGPPTPRQPMTPGGYLPSPPPTNRYGIPPPPPGINPQSPMYSNMQPQASSPHQFQTAAPKQPPPQQNRQPDYPGAFHQQIPPTPVDSFPPPAPVPTKPPDPTQAGTLLSILKGTAPTPTLPENVPPTTSTAAPKLPLNLQSAPASRKLPPQQQHLRQPAARPSTTGPRNMHFAPPPRPGTTQPPPTSQAAKTPTVISHYGAHKNTSPVMSASTFDRRTSVAGDQAKTLLAMFRTQNADKQVPETAVKSPELATKPVVAPERTNTPGGRAVKPKDRENLLAYLENVAKGF